MRKALRPQFAALPLELARARTEVANVETRLIRWLVGVVLGAATLSVAVVAALLRFSGWPAADVPDVLRTCVER